VTGLWHHHTDWSSQHTDEVTTISKECCKSSGAKDLMPQSCHANSAQLPLATSLTPSRFQDCCPCVEMQPQHFCCPSWWNLRSSVVVVCTHLMLPATHSVDIDCTVEFCIHWALNTVWNSLQSAQHANSLLLNTTRIPSGIWSRLYGWLLWMCVTRTGSFPSALNTWSKVWPWILIWAYLIWNFALFSGPCGDNVT